MPTSAVEICNSALLLVGADAISSLTEATIPARLANRLYEPTRNQLLANHPWNFASVRVELAEVDITPAYDWSYAFQLPNDCLRVLNTNFDTEDIWKIEGRYLMSNNSTAKILYISAETEVINFSPGFSEALTYKLAQRFAYPLTQSSTLADRLFKEYLVHLRDARSQDAQEGAVEKIEANEWLNSRY